MVNPKVEGAGEDNGNGDKGKRKLVFPSDTSMEIPRSNRPDLRRYEVLAESLRKTMIEVQAWRQRSEQSKAKQEIKEEKPVDSVQAVWDDPMACQLEELLIHHLKEAFQSAMKTIVEIGYSKEEAEWAVLSSGLYIGSEDITSDIVASAMVLLINRKEIETIKPLMFESVESLANYALVEMVNVLRDAKPFLTVAEAMWLLLICDLDLLQARAAEGQSLYQFNKLKCSCCTKMEGTSSGESRACALQKGSASASSSAVPENNAEKDEAIALLMLQKQQLHDAMQAWTDWTNVKVREAAQKLSRDQAELRMLRQEKNTAENVSELERALSCVDDLMEMANSALSKAEAEYTVLLKGLADSKLISEHSAKKLQEAKVREQEFLQQCRTVEVEMSFLQGDLVALKGEEANLLVQLEKARRRHNEIEALRQHEEREKTKFLRLVESIERERTQLIYLAKVEEDNLRAMEKANRLMFEERINKLNAEISGLRLTTLGDYSGKVGVKRERECVMCLTQESSVAFLPCAHQVLCIDCNVVHEQIGMNDCPSCRTPIVQRIVIAGFAPPKAR